jgi:polysaccharide biosynthesis protein PelC
MTMRKHILLIAGLTIALGACTVHHMQPSSPLPKQARWVVLPVVNLAEAPLAGEKVEALLDNALRLHGLKTLQRQDPPASKANDLLLSDQRRYEQALAAARQGDAGFAVTGSVQEWRYKTGLDGEPAVGLTLQVLELPSARVLWTASGAKTGWGYANVSGTAQQLIAELLESLTLK